VDARIEAAHLIDNLMRLEPRYRRPSGKEIGERIRLTNTEREMRKAWRIAPVDMTAVELNEQRKAKDRARRRLKRAEAGAVSRQAYLAKAKSKLQPWKASGVSRSSWYRHMRQVRPRQDLTTSGTTCLNHPRASSGEPVSASETTRRLVNKRKAPKTTALKYLGQTCLKERESHYTGRYHAQLEGSNRWKEREEYALAV
jgi:hypothetical protein